MCDVRLFKSAYLDYQAAKTIYQTPYNDEMFFNNAAYHLQQCIEKILKGALECVGVTVPNTHRIAKLLQMIRNNGANLVVTDWIYEHAEMLSEWEAETRYNMDFIVEKRKLDQAIVETQNFLRCNGISQNLRPELCNPQTRDRLLSFLPKKIQNCDTFDLNCYYIMFQKRLNEKHHPGTDETPHGTTFTSSPS